MSRALQPLLLSLYAVCLGTAFPAALKMPLGSADALCHRPSASTHPLTDNSDHVPTQAFGVSPMPNWSSQGPYRTIDCALATPSSSDQAELPALLARVVPQFLVVVK